MSAAAPACADGRIDQISLRLSVLLVGWACRRLPEPDREDRFQEWTCELYAIFDDPDLSRALQRASRALLYALDHHRGVHHLCARPVRSRQVRQATIQARLRTVALVVLDNIGVGLGVGVGVGVVGLGVVGVGVVGLGVGVVVGVASEAVVRYRSRSSYFKAEKSSRRHKKEPS